MLSGPPGVGKTSSAFALAHQFGWDLVEMNASDARNEAAIDEVAGRASRTHRLVGGRIDRTHDRLLILLDEADCLTGRPTEERSRALPPLSLREFLRGRYRTIEELNRAWGMGGNGGSKPFPKWEAVPLACGSAAWTRLPAAQADLREWSQRPRPRDLSDRGGLGAIARLVRETQQPLVLTVNDDETLLRYSPVFRRSVMRISFRPLLPGEIRAAVGRIARAEGFSLSPTGLDELVRRSQGDLRAAINDLEAMGRTPPPTETTGMLGSRDRAGEIESLLRESLGAARFYRAIEVRERADATPDDLVPWIEENLPREAPDPAHGFAAFEMLAEADRCLQRARRYRTYGLWSYASEILTGGVGSMLHDRPTPVDAPLHFPQFLGEMGRSRASRANRESVTAKIGAACHLSRRKARDDMLPLVESLFHPSRAGTPVLASRVETVRRLALTPADVSYLAQLPPDSEEVQSLFLVPPEPPEPTPEPVVEPPESPTPTVPDSPVLPPAEPAPVKKRVQRSLGEFEGAAR